MKEAIRKELDRDSDPVSLKLALQRELDRLAGPASLRTAIQKELDRSPAGCLVRKEAISTRKGELCCAIWSRCSTRGKPRRRLRVV